MADALRTLVRLDLANGRAFLRGAVREPIFVMAALLAVIAAVVAFRRLLAAEVEGDLRPLIVMLASAYLVATFYVWNSQGHLQRLMAGPFQPLVASPGLQAVWLAARSLVFGLVFLLLAAVAALTLDPLSAPAFLAEALIGLVIGAVATAAVGSVLSMASSGRRRGPAAELGKSGPDRPPLRPASVMLAWAHMRRKIGPVPLYAAAGALLVLGGAAGGLASQNSGPTVGVAVVMAFALAAAWLLVDVDLTVVRQLGHEPMSLARLASVFVGPVLVVMIGSFAAAFAAGLGPLFAIVITTLIALVVLVYLVLMLLNGLVLSPPAARLAAGVDMGLAIVLPLMVGIWGEFWIVGRIFMLILAARRLRWRDL